MSYSLSTWLSNMKADDVDDIDGGLAADFDGSLSGLGVEMGSSTYNMSEALLALPVFKEENFQQGFQYVLTAATSPATKINEETLTYLNQGQSYEVKLKKHGDASNLRGRLLRSAIRVVFHERRLQYMEREQMLLWKQQRVGERIVDIDVPLSYGILDVKVDPNMLNALEVVWDSRRDTGVYIKVHCISTEFTAKKHGGEKGVPFRIQVETYIHDPLDRRLLHAASCQIKVFKPKGADRKHKTDREKVDKRSEAEKEKYQPSYECTALTEVPLEHVQSYLDQLDQQQQLDFELESDSGTSKVSNGDLLSSSPPRATGPPPPTGASPMSPGLISVMSPEVISVGSPAGTAMVLASEVDPMSGSGSASGSGSGSGAEEGVIKVVKTVAGAGAGPGARPGAGVGAVPASVSSPVAGTGAGVRAGAGAGAGAVPVAVPVTVPVAAKRRASSGGQQDVAVVTGSESISSFGSVGSVKDIVAMLDNTSCDSSFSSGTYTTASTPTALIRMSEPLTPKATAQQVTQWLHGNRFSGFVKVFQNFTGADFFRLSREDLIQICGLADGIRLNNALQSRTVRPKLTIYVCQTLGSRGSCSSIGDLDVSSASASRPSPTHCGNLSGTSPPGSSPPGSSPPATGGAFAGISPTATFSPAYKTTASVAAKTPTAQEGSQSSGFGGGDEEATASTPQQPSTHAATAGSHGRPHSATRPVPTLAPTQAAKRRQREAEGPEEVVYIKKQRTRNLELSRKGVYHAVYLEVLTMAHLAEKLADLFSVSTHQILEVHSQGPSGIHILVNDDVVQNFKNQSRYAVEAIQDELYTSSYRILLISMEDSS